jgi:hypothetical protein
MNAPRRLLASSLLALLACTAACAAESGADTAEGDESDLTSVTARSRDLQFVGKVFVEANAPDSTILSAVRAQSQTAFGPLRGAEIAVNSRELKEVDPSTFKRRAVKVVDPSVASDPGKEMLEVTYTYKDRAVVAVSYARKTTVPLAVMGPGYRAQSDRVLTECTANDQHARDFASSLWYVFDPAVGSCREAIKAEQQKIDADRAKVRAPDLVAKSEAERLYLPITVKLGPDKTNRGASYPEYHRLYAGGVQKDKLIVSLVYGLIDHDHSGGPAADFNFGELMTTLEKVMDTQDGWRVGASVDGVDLSSFTLASGKKVSNPSIKDLVKVHSRSDSLGLSYADGQDLDKQLAERIYRKWFTVERPVTVKIGTEAPRDVMVQFLVYYGADSASTPHKYAIKNSDVFLYNGHSYIGYGPLDPSNFTAADFPKSYQLLWVDGCVSYNYYEKDYYPLKDGGSKNLEIITNGLEAPSWRSGHAMGQFLAKFLDGKNASYRDLLLAAEATEAMRVVEGEIDNEFTPARFPISITPR